MTEATIDMLAQRLDRLERQNRQFKRLTIVALVGLAAVGTIGAAVPKPRVIEAERFVVTDSAGNVRARLHADGGTAEFEFYDASKNRRAALSVAADGMARLTFWGSGGEESVSLMSTLLGSFLTIRHQDNQASVSASVGASVTTAAGQGDDRAETDLTTVRGSSALGFVSGQESTWAKRVQLGWNRNATSSLRIWGDRAKSTAEISLLDQGPAWISVTKEPPLPDRALTPEETIIRLLQPREHATIGLLNLDGHDMPGLALVDKQGRIRAGLGLRSDETPVLTLQTAEKEKANRVFLSLDASGRPVLQLSDPAGATRLAVGIGEDAGGTPYLTFFDKQGKPIAPAQPSANHWVLWRQAFLPGAALGAPLQQITVALGAWPTRAECETERATQDQAKPSGVARVHSCLPDSVNLRDRR